MGERHRYAARRPLRVALAAVAASVAMGLLLAPSPAYALLYSEAAFQTYYGSTFFLIGPNVVKTRDQLAAQRFGLARPVNLEYVYWAPATVMYPAWISQWSYRRTNGSVGWTNPNNVLGAWTPLHMLSYGGLYTSMCCGNQPPVWAPPPSPPMLFGYKFSDTDADGTWDAGEPTKSGVEIRLINGAGACVARTWTNAAGYFEFRLSAEAGFRPGAYRLEEVCPAGYRPTTWPGPLWVPEGAADARYGPYYFGNVPLGDITGGKIEDLDADGLAEPGEPSVRGVLIELYRGGVLQRSTRTDAAGRYSFTGLLPGAYAVKEACPAGWFASSGTSRDVVVQGLTASQAATLTNYRLVAIGGYKYGDADLSGSRTGTEGPVAGVLFELWRADAAGVWSRVATTTSATDGTFAFSQLKPGTYRIVEPEQAGYFRTTSPDVGVQLVSNGTARVEFGNAVLTTQNSPRTIGFFKHSVKRYGVAVVDSWMVWIHAFSDQFDNVTAATLAQALDTGGCKADKTVMLRIQYLGTLCNVASGRLGLGTTVYLTCVPGWQGNIAAGGGTGQTTVAALILEIERALSSGTLTAARAEAYKDACDLINHGAATDSPEKH